MGNKMLLFLVLLVACRAPVPVKYLPTCAKGLGRACFLGFHEEGGRSHGFDHLNLQWRETSARGASQQWKLEGHENVNSAFEDGH